MLALPSSTSARMKLNLLDLKKTARLAAVVFPALILTLGMPFVREFCTSITGATVTELNYAQMFSLAFQAGVGTFGASSLELLRRLISGPAL